MTSTPTTSAPGDGSRTQILVDSAPRPEDAEGSSNATPIGTLRLRVGRQNQPRVAWDENVVDNEGCGRKSSKICCIYHKPRKFDESSSEEDSDSDSDSSINIRRRRRHMHDHDHDHNHNHDHDGHRPQVRPDHPTIINELDADRDRNAYETTPSSRKGKKKDVPPS